MQKQLNQALIFLRCNVLKNIVLLKMLQAYPAAIRCHYTESPAAGVLLLLPTQASAFDKEAYPAAQFVVFLSTTTPATTQALLPHIRTDCNLVFKLMDAHDQAAVERYFPLERITSYLSYTCPAGSNFLLSPHIVVAETVDPRCLDLYAEQGYSLKPSRCILVLVKPSPLPSTKAICLYRLALPSVTLVRSGKLVEYIPGQANAGKATPAGWWKLPYTSCCATTVSRVIKFTKAIGPRSIWPKA
jgi:hypothetical protein